MHRLPSSYKSFEHTSCLQTFFYIHASSYQVSDILLSDCGESQYPKLEVPVTDYMPLNRQVKNSSGDAYAYLVLFFMVFIQY